MPALSIGCPSDLLEHLVAASPAALFAVNADGCFAYLNPAWAEITGFDAAGSLGRPCLEFVHPEDRSRLAANMAKLISGQEAVTRSEYRAKHRHGGYRWVEVRTQASLSPDYHLTYLFGTISDIDERKRNEAISQGEQAILEAMAGGSELRDLFDRICHLCESLVRNSRASILVLDEERLHLRFGAAPNLAADYNAAIDGVRIGPNVGSCGTAAFSGRPVLVSDIASDPLWCDHSHLALRQGLKACWSYPLIVDTGLVLGTLAVYRTESGVPDGWESEVCRRLARLAALAARKHEAEEALKASERRFALAVRGANVGIWEVNFGRGGMFTSPIYRELVGLDLDTSTRWSYPEELLPAHLLERMHPDDRARSQSAMRRHLDENVPLDVAYRICRSDGGHSWFHAKGQAVWDDEGRPMVMAGSIVDITVQVLASERLRESEQRFRDFAETASDWFWETDADLHITSVSDWILDNLGVDLADVIGRPLVAIVAEDTRTAKWQEHINSLRSWQPFRNFEYDYRHPNGNLCRYRINGKPVFSAEGRFLGYRGTGTDVTAERRTLAVLEVRERQLSQAQRIARLGDWRWRVGDSRLDWSDEMYRIFGLERGSFDPVLEEVLGFLLPRDRVRVAAALERAVAEAHPFEAEHRMLRPDGEVRVLWVEGRCELSDDGQVTHVFGICQDVTERVRQQQALEQRERELLHAQQIARMGHWRLAVDTGELELSQGCRSLLGVQPGQEDLSWQRYLVRIHPDDRPEVIEKLDACIAAGGAGRWEYRVRTFHEEERIMAVEGQCEFDAVGNVIAMFGIIQDVTEQRLLQQKLRAAKEAAEAASRAKSTFLATMSHELRTPLNAVIGFSDILASETLGPLSNERYREYAEDIHRSGQHLLELINDVLDTARIEAGQVVLQTGPVDMEALAAEAVRLLHHQADAAGLNLDLVLPAPVPLIRADLRRLRQVLINLLGNAIKFTPAGGRISLEVAGGTGAVELIVADTGVGIPPERIHDLAKPFTQVGENVLSRRHTGSGLGLYISRSLVELHGGTLRIESTLGAGTRVTVRLPCRGADRMPIAEMAASLDDA